MIRNAAMQLAQRGDRHFRWRGADVSRVETLFDAVIALAMTLVIVSLEVPERFVDLSDSFQRLPAFAACFFILVMIWYYHYIFHRRYGLEDFPTIILNAIGVFVVLIYVYPMKFVYTGLFDRDQIVLRNQDYPTLMRMFSIGWIGVFTIFVLLYAHAWRRRDALELNEAERLITRQELSGQSLNIVVGLISLAITTLDQRYLPFSGIVYALIGPFQGLNGWYFLRHLPDEPEHVAAESPIDGPQDRG